VTRGLIVALAVLGAAGQAAIAAFLVVGAAALAGFGGPLWTLRRVLSGYELWLAFVVAAVATAGSLFFSEVANFVPCELCWFQRIFIYPLSIVTLLAAIRHEFRIVPYLLPLPVIGAGISAYHILVENGVVEQTASCSASAPSGCATKWIEEFGYLTIPTLALTASVLLIIALGLARRSAPVSATKESSS
jgi:disulfide bond formation protein DsbB